MRRRGFLVWLGGIGVSVFLFFRTRSLLPLPGRPRAGPLDEREVRTLHALAGALLPADDASGGYHLDEIASLLEARTQGGRSPRTAGFRFLACYLDRAAARTGESSFAHLDSRGRREALRASGIDSLRLSARGLASPSLIEANAARYLAREFLEWLLFHEGRAWRLVGYSQRPGTCTGFDDYTRPPHG